MKMDEHYFTDILLRIRHTGIDGCRVTEEMEYQESLLHQIAQDARKSAIHGAVDIVSKEFGPSYSQIKKMKIMAAIYALESK